MVSPHRYRRTPTPGGLEDMETEELTSFDLEMYANLNTGVLEEYLEERHRRQLAAPLGWGLAFAAAVGGVAFAVVNTFLAMRLGLLVAGAFYLVVVLALARGAPPAAGGTAAGAAAVGAAQAAGVGLVAPAVFLLAEGPGRVWVPEDLLPTWGRLAVVALAGGTAGLFVAAALRRRWVVEDPLPLSGVAGHVQVLELADAPTEKARARSRLSLRFAAAGATFGALWALLRDLPLRGDRRLLDGLLGAYHVEGAIAMPVATARWTWLGFNLSPLLAAVGWFLRARGALVLLAGSALTWLLAVPLAVAFDVAAFAPGFEGRLGLQGWWELGLPSALVAFRGPVRVLGAGVLLGTGLAVLVRRFPALAHGVATLRRRPTPVARPTAGWYAWPAPSAALVAVVAVVVAAVGAASTDVALAGPVLVLVATGVLVGVPASLGAYGEEGRLPLLGVVATLLLATMAVGLGLNLGEGPVLVAGTLAGVAVAAAVATAGAAFLAHKVGLYAGVTPYRVTRLQFLVLVGATLAASLTADFLLTRQDLVPLVPGASALALPYAAALEALLRLLLDGTGATILLVGILFGILADILTGRGVLFGIGALLPFGAAAAIATGGGLHHLWERRVAKPAASRREGRDKWLVRLLDTYLVAAGVIVGEVVVALVLLGAV